MAGTRKIGIGLIAVAAASLGLVLGLGSGQARVASESGCTRVSGRLVDEHVDQTLAVGRMIGGIEGRYEFTMGPLGGSDPGTTVLFGTGDTRIITKKGTLLWHESNAFDGPHNDRFNNAILASVTGGTGAFAGATGHVILAGYWDITTNTGELEYEGEVCTV
jgi:hypothetical protein